jgi:hypothetical protein
MSDGLYALPFSSTKLLLLWSPGRRLSLGLKLLKRFTDNDIDRRTVTRYTTGHNLLTLKHMRKVSWRLMMKVMLRGIAMFVKSRFGELRISEARYEDLLSEVVKHYPKYIT